MSDLSKSSDGVNGKPKITRVLLVRHGSTEFQSEDRFAGAVDVELSEEGNDVKIKETPIKGVYASPTIRTMKTAEIIARYHPEVKVVAVDGIKEINHGHWEGKTRVEIEKEYGEEYRAWEIDPFTYAPPNGESGLKVLSRALPAFLKIVEGHPGETIVVVSHKATIRLLIGSFLGFDLRRYRDTLDQHPCCVNMLDFTARKPPRARLTLFNDISHYNPHPEHMPIKPRLSKIWSFEIKNLEEQRK